MSTPNQSGDLAKQALEVCICLQTRKASRSITQIFDQILAPVGVKATQLSLLMVAQARGPIAMCDLANALVTDATSLSRSLKPLLAKDMVSFTNSPNDRRVKLVSLTATGRLTLDQALPLWQKAQTLVVRQLSSAVVQSLLPVLESAAQLEHNTT